MLATFPLTSGYPDGELIFDVVFFVVVISVLAQGLTVAGLARRLGMHAEPDVGASVAEALPLRRWARASGSAGPCGMR